MYKTRWSHPSSYDLLYSPTIVRRTSVTAAKSSALQAAALHQLVLPVERSGQGLRRSCVHVVSAACQSSTSNVALAWDGSVSTLPCSVAIYFPTRVPVSTSFPGVDAFVTASSPGVSAFSSMSL